MFPTGPGAIACDERGSPVLATWEAGALAIWAWTGAGWEHRATHPGWAFGHVFAAWDRGLGDMVVGMVQGSLAGPHGAISGPWGLPPPFVDVRWMSLRVPSTVHKTSLHVPLVRCANATTAVNTKGGVLLQLGATEGWRTLWLGRGRANVVGEPRRPELSPFALSATVQPGAPDAIALDERAARVVGTGYAGTFVKSDHAWRMTFNGMITVHQSVWRLVEGVASARSPVTTLAFDPQRGAVVGMQAGRLVALGAVAFRPCEPRVDAPPIHYDSAMFADRLRGGLVAYGQGRSGQRETWVTRAGGFVEAKGQADTKPKAVANVETKVEAKVDAKVEEPSPKLWPADASRVVPGEATVPPLRVPVVVPDGATLLACLPLGDVVKIARAKNVVIARGPSSGDVHVWLVADAPAAIEAGGRLVEASTAPFEDTDRDRDDKVGGHPRHRRPIESQKCVSCTRPMTFVAQLTRGTDRFFAYGCPGGCSARGFVQT